MKKDLLEQILSTVNMASFLLVWNYCYIVFDISVILEESNN